VRELLFHIAPPQVDARLAAIHAAKQEGKHRENWQIGKMLFQKIFFKAAQI